MNRVLEELRRAREAVRRNERPTAWLLVAAIGLVCLGLLTPPIRDRFLVRAQVSVARWDARWTDRVEQGERLVAAGRYEEAAAYLQELDGVFPARHVKHGRDVERERLLRALGEANLALGRKRASLEALRSAVAFDERNYLNHFALADAALQLGEPEEALVAFERVLAIYPGHLPTVTALIAYHFERADYRSVADAYEAYLDATVLHNTTIELGNGVGRADVAVDGHFHEIDVALVAGTGVEPARGRSLRIDGGPFPTRVAGVTLMPPVRAGVLGAAPVSLSVAGGWSNGSKADAVDAAAVGEGSVEVPVGPVDVEAARAHIVLRLLKPVNADTWEMVRTSFRNLLESDALESARERSAIVVAAAAGSGEEPS